jgi:hypothetical protein
MKTARTLFLVLASIGFLFSFIIHLLLLSGHVPASDLWSVAPFLGALVSFASAAYLSGAKRGPMGAIPASAIVKDCPSWLKSAEYFFFAYSCVIFLWIALFTWRKVELPAKTSFVLLSAVSMSFYVSSFLMLFWKLSGKSKDRTSPEAIP